MKIVKALAAISAFVLLSAMLGIGQTTFGVIAGSVTDSSGAVVPGATVSVERTDGGEPKVAKTGASGDYRVESLIPGTYTVKVAAEHFAQVELSNITVSASVTTPVSVKLSVGATTEMVTVDASTPQLQTETGQIDSVIPTVEIRDLPIPGGNPYSLAETLPGVSMPDQRSQFTNGADFSVNGLRPRANNFLIDGFDNNDSGISGQALQPTNQEAVSTITVLQNAYAAEYGRGGGSVSNLVYKSGTNTFHGSVWEQYSGAALDAVTAAQQANGETSPPHQVNNLFGFTLGGPVVKNKLFFFATDQWNRQIGAQPTASTLTIPTAAGINTIKQVLAGNPGNTNAQILLDSLGGLVASSSSALPNPVHLNDEPGCTGCSVQFGTLTRTDSGRTLSYEWTVRGDYTASDRDQIFARFTNTYSSSTPDLFANPSALPPQDTFQGGPARNFGLMWAHTFSPNVVNEFRFSQQTIAFTFAPTAASLAQPIANDPGITFSKSFGGGVTALGGYQQGGFPQGRQHQTWQVQDAISITKGAHNFKIGADLTSLEITDEIPFNSNGLANFTSGGGCTFNGAASTCTDLANFIDGFSGTSSLATVSKQFGNPRISVPTSQQAYYLEDSWKVRSNLTLNYGLRYEYQPPDAENVLPFPAVNVNTILTDPPQTRVPVKPYYNAWGPRFGFSYSPKFWQGLFGEDKTVIRGGAGVFYDSFYTNISVNAGAGFPNTLGGTFFGNDVGPLNGPRGIIGPLGVISSITPTVDPTNTIDTVPNTLRSPKTYQWNLDVQRELPGKLIAQVAYVGTRGEFLYDNQQLNPRVLDLVGGTDNRINPNKGSIVSRSNHGDSIYHGMQLELTRNVGHLSLLAAYTWSRAIDNGSEIFTTTGGSSFWQNVFDPHSDRGPSAFNHTNVASFTWVYALPSPSTHLLNQILGGWETSGNVTFQSGAPETLFFGGFDQNGDGQGNDRPSVGNWKAPINVSNACLNPTIPAGCITGIGFTPDGINFFDAFNNTPGTKSQFRYYANGLGQNGNLGRNSIDLPGLEQYNLSVLKNFKMPFREGQQLELRADFLNAFNHFNAGQNNIAGYGNLLNPGVGVLGPKSLTLDGGRAIQIWLKYSF